MKRKVLVFLLAVAIVMAMLPTAAFAAEFSDMPNNWSTAALQSAVANGLLTGTDGKLMPNENLTRAQMATIINRAFGSTQKASLNKYSDVASGAWYYADMAKAVQMKTFMGSGNKLNPDNNITREEAFVVLARAFKLAGSAESNLAKYSDQAIVSSWAKDSMASLVAAGYVVGSNNQLNPKVNITRAQFAQVMYNLLKNYIKTAGTYTEVSTGNVMINAPDVTLKNVTIKGDLILGDGVGNGEVTLDNVQVTGRTVVRGGGINSIKIIGNSQIGSVIIAKVDGNVRVVTEGGAAVEIVVIDDGKDDVVVEGKIGTIEVAASNVPVVVQNAVVTKVTVTAPEAKLSIGSAAAVEEISVSQAAQGTAIRAAKGANITNVQSQAPNTLISGEGNVKNANIQGNNSSINTVGTKVEVGNNVIGTTSGGQAVAGGTTGTTNSGGGVTKPSSGGSSTVAVSAITVTPTTMTLTAGGATGTITATVAPANATNKNLIWTSSDPDVATVANGVVTPKAAGTAIITTASAAYGTKKATTTVTVVAPDPDTVPDTVPIGPFTPGAGGSISAPSFTAEPRKIGGLYIVANHYIESAYELVLSFRPYVEAPAMDTLQYSYNNGETWEDAADFIKSVDGDTIYLDPSENYQYRVSVGGNVYSNVVEASLPNAGAGIYLNIQEVEQEGEGYSIGSPYVGSGLQVNSNIFDSEFNEITEDLSYQWYRVNPVTFELNPIEGATNQQYTRTEADAGYLLLVQAALENSNVFAQTIYRPDWYTPFTIFPNKAFVTNLSENGFTLNLYKGVEGIMPEDLSLYDEDSGDEISIVSVTPGTNNAIYHIAATIPESFNYLYIENTSDLWWIVTESEEYGIYSGMEIIKAQTVDISSLVNGGTVAGPETAGFTIDTTSGAEKVNIAAGTATDVTYSFTITNSAQGTVQNIDVFLDNYNWRAQIQNTVLNLSTQISTGSAVQLQAVSGFTLNSGAKNVTIDETMMDVRDRIFYFDVTGGGNDGKRFKVTYNGFWKAEEVTAIITTLAITGPDTIEVKRYGTPFTRYTPDTTFTAEVKDQNGDAMTGEGVTWAIKVPQWGLSVGANTGIVTVDNWIGAGSFVLVATSATDNSKKVEKTITLSMEDRREKVINWTTVGVLSGGNIIAVPAGTKVSELKAGLTVSDGATFEILAAAGGAAVADQVYADVTSTMMIEVTAENGDKAAYTITMATYSINLTDAYGVGSVIGTDIELPYPSHPSIFAPEYTWDHTTMVIEIYRTGTGDITNLQVVSSDPSKFAVLLEHPVNPPGIWTPTLNQNRTETMFYVHAVEGLPSGVHTGTFTVTADNGVSESFNVIFRVGT